MVNLIKTSEENNTATENEKQNIALNSAVKYREQTLEYNELRNQVVQEYYYKIHGCSVKAQE
jgi:hypothetical protein